jgi:hypothetical protein
LYDSTALFNTDIYNKKYGKFIHAEESDDSTAITKSGRAIRRRVAKGEFGPTPLFLLITSFQKLSRWTSIKCYGIF